MNSKLTAGVIIDGKASTLVYEYNDYYHNLYIGNFITLINLDSSIDKDYSSKMHFNRILEDIAAHKIKILKYTLFGMVKYDFVVENSQEWNDYPRPTNLSLALLQKFGKRSSCGYLELEPKADG